MCFVRGHTSDLLLMPLEEAIAYAEQNGIPYRVFEPHPRAMSKKSCSDNFKFGRIGSWMH